MKGFKPIKFAFLFSPGKHPCNAFLENIKMVVKYQEIYSLSSLLTLTVKISSFESCSDPKRCNTAKGTAPLSLLPHAPLLVDMLRGSHYNDAFSTPETPPQRAIFEEEIIRLANEAATLINPS